MHDSSNGVVRSQFVKHISNRGRTVWNVVAFTYDNISRTIEHHVKLFPAEA